MTRWLASSLVALATVSPAAAQGDLSPNDTYALDTVSREVAARGQLRCPKVPMSRYAGDLVPYHSELYVAAAFVERLRRFEAIVRDVAVEVYGRAPRRIRHLGTFNCRRIGGYPTMMSEHGIGNGIDVAGFDFGRGRVGAEVPASLKRPFKITLLKHWDAKGPKGGLHRRFLHTLARRVVARQDVFRVLLGPGYPGHKNHFHFDMAPFRMVEIW